MGTPRRIHQCGAVHDPSRACHENTEYGGLAGREVHDVAINLHPSPRAVEHYPVSFQNPPMGDPRLRSREAAWPQTQVVVGRHEEKEAGSTVALARGSVIRPVAR